MISYIYYIVMTRQLRTQVSIPEKSANLVTMLCIRIHIYMILIYSWKLLTQACMGTNTSRRIQAGSGTAAENQGSKMIFHFQPVAEGIPSSRRFQPTLTPHLYLCVLTPQGKAFSKISFSAHIQPVLSLVCFDR